MTYNIANLKPVPFSIDHFSGEIRTAKSFDFEVDRREFQLVIRASDWGQPSRRQSQTTLDIRLQDANDNRPRMCFYYVFSFHLIILQKSFKSNPVGLERYPSSHQS